MPFDRFMIAPYETGLQKDLSPWLIPDEAFERLNNAYVYHGRVIKRFGETYMNLAVADDVAQFYSRFRVNIDTTDGAGNVLGSAPGSIFKVGQSFSIGDEQFTVNATGTPATLLSTGSGSGTFNTNTGSYNISGAAANTDVYFYPSEPVMGLVTYEQAEINDEQYFGFDTQFAYQYVSGEWARQGTAVWTGADYQFFQTANWNGANTDDYLLFVTNYTAADQIKYWDGSTWTTINPAFNSTGDTIESARIIVAFKDRLLFLNTIESVGTFIGRCRYSQNGSPIASDAFREDLPGKGGYIDAATKESIVGAEFLRDRLIVFFDRSTWELVYTSNEILPFRWQKINTELGVESTFSVVPFDKAVLGIGNVGIHACNGINVERIDDKIHDDVFEIYNGNNGIFRVHGIRDYRNQVVYWTLPSIVVSPEPDFPNRVLVYNYENGTWAYNDDSITAFGYYQNENTSGRFQLRDLRVMAGNQEGFTFLVDVETYRNAGVLQITDLVPAVGSATITAINHNLTDEDYILIENTEGLSATIDINDKIFKVRTVIDADSFDIETLPSITGTYTGKGTITRVSKIDILTKQYNFYVSQGRNATIEQVDFQVTRTSAGEIAVDSLPSSSDVSMVDSGIANACILGDGMLQTSAYSTIPLEAFQERVWHPMYLQANGEFVQLRFYLNDDQLLLNDVALSDFEMHAMVFYAQPTSTRLQ